MLKFNLYLNSFYRSVKTQTDSLKCCCKKNDHFWMINKRLLVKNLLAHNDENSFYDKKLRLSLSEKEGKAKFLKHICALSNSNPQNNSYIVVGVRDENNTIEGVDFFDDSKLQNLINAYLKNPPVVSYENIPFPHLPIGKVVGLVSILPTNKGVCELSKNIWKYQKGAVFYRNGSISMPNALTAEPQDINSKTVTLIENHSRNNVKLTLDGVFSFMDDHKSYEPQYRVFKEYFVVCWAGQKKEVKGQTYYSRVDIELINEQVRLFYSVFDEVSITISEEEFKITEYISLGYDGTHKYYPFEELSICFKNNVNYEMVSNVIFEPPIFPASVLDFLMKKNENLIEKIFQKEALNTKDTKSFNELPTTYLLCYLNGYLDALDRLKEVKLIVKEYSPKVYQQYKDVLRVIRKIRYN